MPVSKPRHCALYDRVIATVDPARVRAFQAMQGRRLEQFGPIAAEKYADIPLWLAKKTPLAILLELDLPPRRTILDIGAGGGHFLALCNALGHACLGIDIADPFYAELCDLLGVGQRVSPVLRQQRLPDLGRRFDLVTVVSQKFDHLATHPDGSRTYWRLGDWTFFLQDVMDNQLAPGATFYLKLNKEVSHGERFFNRALLDWCQANGGAVDDANGIIEFQRAEARS